MVFDRALAYAKPRGDILAGMAGKNQFHDLALSWGEVREPPRRSLSRSDKRVRIPPTFERVRNVGERIGYTEREDRLAAHRSVKGTQIIVCLALPLQRFLDLGAEGGKLFGERLQFAPFRSKSDRLMFLIRRRRLVYDCSILFLKAVEIVYSAPEFRLHDIEFLLECSDVRAVPRRCSAACSLALGPCSVGTGDFIKRPGCRSGIDKTVIIDLAIVREIVRVFAARGLSMPVDMFMTSRA